VENHSPLLFHCVVMGEERVRCGEMIEWLMMEKATEKEKGMEKVKE
jgi:hypothetical protein